MRISGQGESITSFVIGKANLEVIQSLLPEELTTGTQDLIKESGQYPVLYLFGIQKNVKPGFWPLWGLNYYEFIIGIPYVVWKNPESRKEKGPFMFMPILCLNKLLPTIAGWFFGMPKQVSRIKDNGVSYKVSTLIGDNEQILGNFSESSDWKPTTSFPNFLSISDFYSLSLICKYPIGIFESFNFNWNLDTAKMESITSQVEITNSFLDGKLESKFSTNGIGTDRIGSYRLQTKWKITNPHIVR
jgi:hypothetical protein